jgi:hypothetical protein
MLRKLLCMIFGHNFKKDERVVYNKIGKEVNMKTVYICQRCGKKEYRDS